MKINRIILIFLFFAFPFFNINVFGFDHEVKVTFTNLNDGAYRLQTEFLVTASPKIVWEVLTDYERLPRFISTMQESKVTARYKNKLIVEQSANIPLFFWVKINRKVILHIEELPFHEIRFIDTAHDQIEQYQGSWKISPEDDSTRVTYQINVKIPYLPFDFFSEKSLIEFSQNNISEVMHEIILRSGQPLSPTPRKLFWVEPSHKKSK